MPREIKTQVAVKKSAVKKPASYHNEESCYVRLFHQHNKQEVEVEITYSGEYPWVVIKQQGKKVHEGAWFSSILVGGAHLEAEDSCVLTCFSSDSDGDYVELARMYRDGLQVDYVVYLPRKHPFILMASFNNQPALKQSSLESVLPGLAMKDSGKISTKLDWLQGAETRELTLTNRDFWRVLPLSVPQFRSQSNGCLVVTNNRLVSLKSEVGSLPQSHVSVITWEEPKAKLPLTWKQVEVGFDVRPVAGDQAVAWRFRIGKEQFLYYRSFVQMIQPRSAMGLHTNYESVLSVVNKDGFHRMLIGIEKDTTVEV
jgi:hypothetical protein